MKAAASPVKTTTAQADQDHDLKEEKEIIAFAKRYVFIYTRTHTHR